MHCDTGLYEAVEGCDRKNFKDRYSERCGKRNVPDWKTSGVEPDCDVWNSGNCGECGGEQCGGICQYSGYCDRTCDRDGHWQMQQAKYYSKRLLGLAYAGMVLADLALFVLVKPIIACFALSAEAARIATQLLVSFAICAALIWPLSFTLPNVLRAAGDAKYTMEVSVFSMWVFRVASSYFFAGTMGLGVLGVWIGMYVDWAFRTLLFVIRYRRGRWLEKRVV